ncbi:hypothetical protein BDV39DRAFT_166158 [Aspergillus sergii]|uniref:Zn(2)-C6 fungal-type domain-containing protein n=1 Tax=Aspergillus sergii TaxID=1034303 RepID=A0A5N6XJL7_9EURO|nr:hypothetical protein BDV39DRAFT_166158 [Aspergillus sergii]
MESTPRKSRKLNDPQGVQKSIASHNRVTRTMACQSCHIRKKRCVYVAQHRRCTNCFQEDQPCVPRGHFVRAIEEEPEDPISEASHSTFNLPLPRGIDHEVPRWAAVYSMVQEVLHFLPPEDNISDHHEDIEAPEGDEKHPEMRPPESIAPHPLSTLGDTKDPAFTIENEPEPSVYNISTGCPWNDSARDNCFELMASENGSEGLDLNDIDALLSF